MRIKKISVSVMRIPLRTPFVTSLRRVDSTEDVVIEIETDSGLHGFGAGTPSLRMNGESVGSIVSVVRDAFAPNLVGADASGLEPMLSVLDHSVAANTAAKAAVDIALHDLASQAAGIPLYRFLGGNNRQISTGISISLGSLDEMVSNACAAVRDGFTTLKLKVGSAHGIEDDIRRVQEIRRCVGRQIELGVDANQAWSEKDAKTFANRIENVKVDLAFIEQPVSSADRAALGRVTAGSHSPVLADESCASVREAVDLINGASVDGIAIKLMKLGGIRSARVAYDFARLRSKICAATCLTESPIGIAAMASLCSGRDFRFIDLDSMALITHNPVIGGAEMMSNKVILSDAPGLGIQLVEGLEPVVSIG